MDTSLLGVEVAACEEGAADEVTVTVGASVLDAVGDALGTSDGNGLGA